MTGVKNCRLLTLVKGNPSLNYPKDCLNNTTTSDALIKKIVYMGCIPSRNLQGNF